jgi:thioredoxin 1
MASGCFGAGLKVWWNSEFHKRFLAWARMSFTDHYEAIEPTRAEIDSFRGPLMIEFGNAWCGHCRAAQPFIASALEHIEGVRHIKIADGSGLPLGRSFHIKLWPTLIFMNGGNEKARLVRPQNASSICDAISKIQTGVT